MLRATHRAPVQKNVDLPGRPGAERALAGIINQGWDILDAGLMRDHVRQLLAQRDAAGAVTALPWGDLETHLAQAQNPMASLIGKGMEQELGRIGTPRAGLAFDTIDNVSIRYAYEQSGQLIRNITDSQHETIRGILGDALSGDYTADQAAREIRKGIGLHPAWAEAVDKYEARMRAQPIPKGSTPAKWEQTVQARTERYRQRLVARRAKTIARTEIMTAENLGRYATWADSIASGQNHPDSMKEWSAGPGACPTCAGRAGHRVRWDEAFPGGSAMPPAHPNCRCSAVLLPPDPANPELQSRRIDWTNPAGDRAPEGLPFTAPEPIKPPAPAAAAPIPEAPRSFDEAFSRYAPDPVATQADRLTYDSTLHWSDDRLMEAIGKYADDPEAVDKILAIIDEREAAAAAKQAAYQQLVDDYNAGKFEAPDIKLDNSPATNPAASPKRQPNARQRNEEDYEHYVYSQYDRALDYTNGNFFSNKMAAEAKSKGIDSLDLFRGPYRIAEKYASEELKNFWQEYGRETLGSFRYGAFKRPTDLKHYMTAKNLGHVRSVKIKDNHGL